MLSEKNAIVSLLGPTADYNGSALTSDAVSMENYDELTILLCHKGGTTGLSQITLNASTNASQGSAEAIPFKYRRKTTGASAVWGAITAATAAGIATVAAEDTIIEIYVKSSELPETKMFVSLHGAETVNDPVAGAVIGILSSSRYSGTDQPDCLS